MRERTSLERLWTDDAFRRFFAARTISFAGSSLTYVALPVLVYSLTRSPLLTGVVAGFEAVPYLMFGLVAGALADRWNRQRLMVVSDVLSALALASLPAAAAFGALTVGHVLVVAAVAPTMFVFFDAANFGAVPVLVGRQRIAEANSAIWAAATIGDIAAPAAAGALLALVAPTSLIAIDALTFAASAFFIRAIRRPMSDPEREGIAAGLSGLRHDVAEGLRFLVRQAHVRTMTILGACQSIAGGAFVGQMVVWADRSLGVRAGNVRLGFLFGGWGVGALVAAMLTPRLSRRFGAARLVLTALPASAVLATATALAPNWVAGTLLLVAWSSAYMLVVISTINYRQQVTPERLMSRVNTAGRMLSFGAGFPAGALVGGAVAGSAGPVAGMLAGAVVAAFGATYAWMSPLRSLAPSGQSEPAVR
ncbi:MAG: MFS transporter [Actinomycetota bacterium]